MDKRKNQSLDSFLNFMDTKLAALHEVSQINLQHALFDFYDNQTHFSDWHELKICEPIK